MGSDLLEEVGGVVDGPVLDLSGQQVKPTQSGPQLGGDTGAFEFAEELTEVPAVVAAVQGVRL